MPPKKNSQRGGTVEGGGGGRGFGSGGGYRGGRGNSRGGFYRGGPPRGFRGGGFRGKSRPKLEVGERLKEVDIGVTEFVGDHEGFAGVVKERYADFHVHEINLQGEVAKLTIQTIPPEPEELENMEDLKKNLPQEIWDQLEMLMEADNLINSIDINVTDMNKDQRRVIHAVAKKIPHTISQTVDQGEKKIIVIAKANKQKLTGHKFRRDQRQDWGRRGGNYCHFLLHKVNMDTMDALNQMAMFLRIKSNLFNYAGTKDRRARTTQWVSLKKISPIHILEAGKAVRGAYVGNFKFSEEPLRLGLLSGNRFRIALRTITGTDIEIEKAMTSLRDKGFINYYGLQRFGTVAAIPTHHIGRALLQGKWNDAIELILKPRVGEQQRDLVEARELYMKTRDPLAAFGRIGRTDKIEAKLLWGLHLCGEKNPQGALDWIPRNTCLMYIHAYQSYIWNHMVSRRIRELGLKPVVGDLVYENRDFKEDTEALDYGPQENDKEINIGEKKNEEEKGQKRQNSDDKEESKEMKVEEEIEASGQKRRKIGEGESEKLESPSTDDNKDEPSNSDKPATETICVKQKLEETDKTETKNSEIEVKNKEGEETSNGKNSKNSDEILECTEAGESSDKEKDEKNKSTLLEEEKNEDSHTLPAVKILEEEDLPNYTLADIVMPQPGWRVMYPPYAKPWFDEILAKDDLTTDLRQKNKKYSLGGAYRKMLEVPADLSWSVMRYKERYDELILCDVDEMRGLAAPKDEPDGKYRALIVKMSLKPCTYATMALREILKCDTSPQTQAAQSAAHIAQEKEEEEEKKKKEEEEDSTIEKIEMNTDDVSDTVESEERKKEKKEEEEDSTTEKMEINTDDVSDIVEDEERKKKKERSKKKTKENQV